MRVRSLSFSSVLALAFAAAPFAAAVPAHADTYQIVGSWFEDTWGFDGIDPSGHVYLQNFFAVSDFQTEILSPTGGSIIINSSLPLTFVSDRGSSCLESAPGFPHALSGLCNGTRFAFLYAADAGPDTSLYMYPGTGDAQLVSGARSGDLMAMNSLGDIVFDNGFVDTAYYAVDLTTLPTPEPSSLLLLATGALGLTAFAIRRRRAANSIN
jgi:hypothetical protein